MAFCRLLLADGSYLELTDGTPFLLSYDDCADETEPPTSEGGGGRLSGAKALRFAELRLRRDEDVLLAFAVSV